MCSIFYPGEIFLENASCYRVIALHTRRSISTSPNSRERPLIMKTGSRMGYHRKRKREKEGGWMPCFMKKKDKSLLDVENVARSKQCLIGPAITKLSAGDLGAG